MKQQVATCIPDFSPYDIVEKIKEDEACQVINQCFKDWGIPQRIKIDNGVPLANISNRDIPTLSQLWWIGLGIEVQLNNIRTPQQNGTVEGLQGICRRWSAPHQYEKLEDYQERVNASNLFQREGFRIRKLGDKTRKELYPELWNTPRPYCPDKFCIQKVYNNLSQRVWERKIDTAGSVRFWKMHIYIGKKFAKRRVTITFDPLDRQWIVRNSKGVLLKMDKKMPFTEEKILQNAGISSNS